MKKIFFYTIFLFTTFISTTKTSIAGGEIYLRNIDLTNIGNCKNGQLVEEIHPAGNIHGRSNSLVIGCINNKTIAEWVFVANTSCYYERPIFDDPFNQFCNKAGQFPIMITSLEDHNRQLFLNSEANQSNITHKYQINKAVMGYNCSLYTKDYNHTWSCQESKPLSNIEVITEGQNKFLQFGKYGNKFGNPLVNNKEELSDLPNSFISLGSFFHTDCEGYDCEDKNGQILGKKEDCPENFDFNKDIIWIENKTKNERQPVVEYLKAKITTKQGIFNCQVTYLNYYLTAWELKCDNQSDIIFDAYQLDNYKGLVIDKNKSQYQMSVNNIFSSNKCDSTLAIYREIYSFYQQAFDFEVDLEIAYKRKIIPKPVGF